MLEFKGVYNSVNCVKYKTLDNTLLEYVKRAYILVEIHLLKNKES